MKKTNKEMSDILVRAYNCLANTTTSVIKGMKYDVSCADKIQCLHSLLLFIGALERWQQYGDGTPKDDNCLTEEQKDAIIDKLLKSCPNNCNEPLTSTSTQRVLEFSTELGEYLLV